jgi:putative transposase
LKYCPTFPKRFTSIDHARVFCDRFFEHYNHHHRHSGIGLHTPADVHHGRAETVRARRQIVLDAAYAAHPERFRCPPSAPRIPEATWINRPEETPIDTIAV